MGGKREEKKKGNSRLGVWLLASMHPAGASPAYGNLLFYLEVGTLSKLWFFRFKLLKLVKDIMNESVGNDEAPYALNTF